METILCQRRIDILEHLFDFSASTAEQIGRDVLKNVSPSFVYSEMRQLEKRGLVGRMYFERNGRAKGAYVLTPKGFGLVGPSPDENFQIKKFKPQSLIHEIELVDVAFRLRRLKALKSYYTENQLFADTAHLPDELKREISPLRPDALMALERDGKCYYFAVEYEANRKYRDRIREKIDRYYGCEELFGCLFIGKKKDIIDRTKAEERRENTGRRGKIYYGLLEDVKKEEKKMTFYNKDDEKFMAD